MKFRWLLLSGMLVAMNQALSEDLTELKTDKERLSYGIGASVAKNLKKQTTDVDLDVLIQGLKNGLSGQKLLLSEKELQKVMNKFQGEVRQNALLSKRLALEENKKKGEVFLSENKLKPGVEILPSGVQYKVLKAGSGKTPIDSDVVQVNYRGTLLDGTEFDSTESGHPAELKVSSLIAGWKDALKLMPLGSKWQIVIPSQLAYGERGVGSDIGPNETLVFEVELLAIK
ncbi:MAG: FKBP-type peptidyl-prolyl cis-trans isomerase [Gallionella sp.]|nr:FKBP-type peptidyl-prolyl cis-trans isomerase [Gallionella sp.]